jgi:hypothetical protein
MGMRFQALDVQVVASGADGRTLVGEPVPTDPTQPLTALLVLTSTHDGAAWTALPVYPAPPLCCSTYNIVQLLTGRPQAAAVAPDGTVVTYLLINGDGGAGGILALAPGAASWRYVATPPTESFAAFHFRSGRPSHGNLGRDDQRASVSVGITWSCREYKPHKHRDSLIVHPSSTPPSGSRGSLRRRRRRLVLHVRRFS